MREFQVPKLNFKATEYYDCIDWVFTEISEPPITKSLSSEEIQDNINSGSILEESLACFPSHSHAVERTVKIVTEAASKICGNEGRDAFIRAKLQSRKKCQNSFRRRTSYSKKVYALNTTLSESQGFVQEFLTWGWVLRIFGGCFGVLRIISLSASTPP